MALLWAVVGQVRVAVVAVVGLAEVMLVVRLACA